ncbi:aquaporin-5-like isoform X2 [Stegodyphus dumicola]|nr:aquaporin-5-like isoform X2 [Stegodyphus dumicola]
MSGIGHRENLGCTVVTEYLSTWQAMGLELVLTFIVAFTMCATADPNRKSLGSDALAVGLAYLVCSLIALPATGASMNPARSLGPAFVMNTWTNHWVYWSGPVLGGLLAGLIYEYIFDSPKKILPTIKERDDSERDISDIKDETDSKSSTVISPRAQMPQMQIQHQIPSGGPFYRPLTPHEGSTMRPHSRSTYTNPKYVATPGSSSSHQHMQPAAYYSSLPRNSAYRTWNEYGTSGHFKF